LRPGGGLKRGSDRKGRESRSDVQKLNRRVRQEERRIVPAGEINSPGALARPGRNPLLGGPEAESSTCPQSHSPNSTARFCPQLGQDFRSWVMDHDLLQAGSPESVAFGESFRPDLFEAFVVILDALAEGGPVRFSGTVDETGFGHRFPQNKTGGEGGSRSQGGPKKGKRFRRTLRSP
jgi:hypothetical protein